MKKYFIIGILFLLVHSVGISQYSSNVKVIIDSIPLGENYITKQSITATEYKFPKKIYDVSLDTTSGNLILLLRGVSRNGKRYTSKGKLVVLNPSQHRVNWSTDLNFNISSVYRIGNKLFLDEYNKTYLLDIETGNRLWSTGNMIFYADDHDDIGLCYAKDYSLKATNLLRGIDMRTGKEIWKRKIKRNNGWDDLLKLNDSTYLIIASGLYSLNLFNGSGWDYNSSTRIDDYSGMILTDVAGAALGVFTGMYFYSTGHKTINGIYSNVVFDSTSCYFVSKNSVARINKLTGQVQWSFGLGKEIASKSKIFLRDSVLYVLNLGYANKNGKPVGIGVAYFSGFNKNTGAKIFFKFLSAGHHPINYSIVFKDNILALYNNRIVKYRICDGAILKQNAFVDSEYGNFSMVLGKRIFISKNDSSLIPISQSDSGAIFVYTEKNKIVKFDSVFKITDTVSFKELYFEKVKKDGYTIIGKDKKVFLLNTDYKKVANLNLDGKIFIMGNKLYATKEKSIVEIDLSHLLHKKKKMLN